MTGRMFIALLSVIAACAVEPDQSVQALDTETPWSMTTIQPGSAVAGTSYRGADGLSALDTDADGWPDLIATPWENSSQVSLSTRDCDEWTTEIIGTNARAEEAVIADVDKDGRPDVISGGEDKQLRVHFKNASGSYTTVTLASGAASQRMMQVALVQVDADPETVEIVAGGKRGSTGDASIRIYRSVTPRIAASWTFREVGQVDWTMSLVPMDVEPDGDLDFVITDKKDHYGMKGARLLEQTEPDLWVSHEIADLPGENNFLHLFDEDLDGDLDVLLGSKASYGGELALVENAGDWRTFTTHTLAYPADFGSYVASTSCDLDGDGVLDLALTSLAAAGKFGVIGLYGPDYTGGVAISDDLGGKFDTPTCVRVGGAVRLYTTEQNRQLGIVALEGP